MSSESWCLVEVGSCQVTGVLSIFLTPRKCNTETRGGCNLSDTHLNHSPSREFDGPVLCRLGVVPYLSIKRQCSEKVVDENEKVNNLGNVCLHPRGLEEPTALNKILVGEDGMHRYLDLQGLC